MKSLVLAILLTATFAYGRKRAFEGHNEAAKILQDSMKHIQNLVKCFEANGIETLEISVKDILDMLSHDAKHSIKCIEYCVLKETRFLDRDNKIDLLTAAGNLNTLLSFVNKEDIRETMRKEATVFGLKCSNIALPADVCDIPDAYIRCYHHHVAPRHNFTIRNHITHTLMKH